jgi:hypothetical protein
VKPNVGNGLYERDGWSPGSHGDRTVTFTRTTGQSAAMDFTLSLVTGDSSTFTIPASVSLPLNQPVPVNIGIAPRTPGVHSALVTLDNLAVPGHAYRMLATIVAADELNESNHFTVVTHGEIPRPGIQSYFYRVPAGASALEIVVDAPKRAAQLVIIKPDTRTAAMTSITGGGGGRGSGGGGGGAATAPRPKETYIVANPMPGVWEIRLTDIEDTHTFDWRASETGGPVPPTMATITVSALAARAASSAIVSDTAVRSHAQGAESSGLGGASGSGDVVLSSRMAPFTGKAEGYPLGSARRERPTIHEHEQHSFEVDVPAGSAALRVTVAAPSDPGADLDVYVYDCTTKECTMTARAADPVGDEIVMVPHPAAGKWKIIVEAASVPQGSTTYAYSDVVFNTVYGAVVVSDTPDKRDGSASWTARTNVWAAFIPPGRQPFAAFLVQGQVTPAQPFTVAMIEVPNNHQTTTTRQSR